MGLEVRRRGEVVVLDLEGWLGQIELPPYAQTIDALIDGGDTRLVLDVHSLTFISGGALGYLVRTSRRARELGGEAVIARPGKYLRRFFVNSDLQRVLPLFDSVEDAVAHFGGGHEGGAPAPTGKG